MAIIIKSGGLKQPESQSLEKSDFRRIATGAGLSALRGLESVASIVPNLLGVKAPHPLPSEQIQQAYNISPESIAPQNFPEEFIQRFAKFAPIAATGGLGALGRTALGSAAATGVGALGAPEWVQDITQLGTEIGSSLAKGKIPTISQAQKTEDTLARAAVKPGSKTSSNLISQSLKTVEDKLSTEVDETLKKKIQHALKTVDKNISKKTINPIDAIDLRKTLYKLGNKLSPYESANYIQPLTKGINDFFAIYAAENPQFWKHLNARDRLTELKHMNTYIDKFADKVFSLYKYPAAKSIISTIGGAPERFFRSLSSNPEARNLYFDMMNAAAAENPQSFIKNADNLSTLMKDIIGTDIEQDITEEPKFKIISGGLKKTS